MDGWLPAGWLAACLAAWLAGWLPMDANKNGWLPMDANKNGWLPMDANGQWIDRSMRTPLRPLQL